MEQLTTRFTQIYTKLLKQSNTIYNIYLPEHFAQRTLRFVETMSLQFIFSKL